MTNEPYNLVERTAKYSEAIIDFVNNTPQTLVTKPLISQLMRSATSIGANYCEADEAASTKDFIHKITLTKKESRETQHWLRLLAYTLPEHREKANKLGKEAHELTLIFAASIRTARAKV